MADNNVLFASLGLWGRHSSEEYLIVLAAMAIVSLVWLASGAQKRYRESGKAVSEIDGRLGSGNKRQEEKTVENVIDKKAKRMATTCEESREVCSIVGALGGIENIYDVGCSDTRLRVKVNSGELVDRKRLKETGAVGVLAKKREVQVFYDDRVRQIYGELSDYVNRARRNENEENLEEHSFERVLKKVYASVEGDVVYLSDIHHVQDMGDGCIGGFAVRATRGEVRAPFDCKAGYSEAPGDGTAAIAPERTPAAICQEAANEIICTSSDGCEVRLQLIADRQHVLLQVRKCADGENVRKGRLLLEYNYDELAACGEPVYAVILVRYAVSRAAVGKAESERVGEAFLKVCAKENVNYEHVACMVVE